MGGVGGWSLLLLETPGEVRGRDVVEKNAEEMNRRLHQVTTRITNHSIVVAGEREREGGRESGRERERAGERLSRGGIWDYDNSMYMYKYTQSVCRPWLAMCQ